MRKPSIITIQPDEPRIEIKLNQLSIGDGVESTFIIIRPDGTWGYESEDILTDVVHAIEGAGGQAQLKLDEIIGEVGLIIGDSDYSNHSLKICQELNAELNRAREACQKGRGISRVADRDIVLAINSACRNFASYKYVGLSLTGVLKDVQEKIKEGAYDDENVLAVFSALRDFRPYNVGFVVCRNLFLKDDVVKRLLIGDNEIVTQVALYIGSEIFKNLLKIQWDKITTDAPDVAENRELELKMTDAIVGFIGGYRCPIDGDEGFYSPSAMQVLLQRKPHLYARVIHHPASFDSSLIEVRAYLDTLTVRESNDGRLELLRSLTPLLTAVLSTRHHFLAREILAWCIDRGVIRLDNLADSRQIVLRSFAPNAIEDLVRSIESCTEYQSEERGSDLLHHYKHPFPERPHLSDCYARLLIPLFFGDKRIDDVKLKSWLMTCVNPVFGHRSGLFYALVHFKLREIRGEKYGVKEGKIKDRMKLVGQQAGEKRSPRLIGIRHFAEHAEAAWLHVVLFNIKSYQGCNLDILVKVPIDVLIRNRVRILSVVRENKGLVDRAYKTALDIGLEVSDYLATLRVPKSAKGKLGLLRTLAPLLTAKHYIRGNDRFPAREILYWCVCKGVVNFDNIKDSKNIIRASIAEEIEALDRSIKNCTQYESKEKESGLLHSYDRYPNQVTRDNMLCIRELILPIFFGGDIDGHQLKAWMCEQYDIRGSYSNFKELCYGIVHLKLREIRSEERGAQVTMVKSLLTRVRGLDGTNVEAAWLDAVLRNIKYYRGCDLDILVEVPDVVLDQYRETILEEVRKNKDLEDRAYKAALGIGLDVSMGNFIEIHFFQELRVKFCQLASPSGDPSEFIAFLEEYNATWLGIPAKITRNRESTVGTILIGLVRHNKDDIVIALLSNEKYKPFLQIDYKDSTGKSAFDHACEMNKFGVMAAFFNSGARVSVKWYEYAKNDNQKAIEGLLKDVKDHWRLGLNEADGEGNTALHHAVMNQSAKMVELLMASDPPPELKVNERGKTPLTTPGINREMMSAIFIHAGEEKKAVELDKAFEKAETVDEIKLLLSLGVKAERKTRFWGLPTKQRLINAALDEYDQEEEAGRDASINKVVDMILLANNRGEIEAYIEKTQEETPFYQRVMDRAVLFRWIMNEASRVLLLRERKKINRAGFNNYIALRDSVFQERNDPQDSPGLRNELFFRLFCLVCEGSFRYYNTEKCVFHEAYKDELALVDGVLETLISSYDSSDAFIRGAEEFVAAEEFESLVRFYDSESITKEHYIFVVQNRIAAMIEPTPRGNTETLWGKIDSARREAAEIANNARSAIEFTKKMRMPVEAPLPVPPVREGVIQAPPLSFVSCQNANRLNTAWIASVKEACNEFEVVKRFRLHYQFLSDYNATIKQSGVMFEGVDEQSAVNDMLNELHPDIDLEMLVGIEEVVKSITSEEQEQWAKQEAAYRDISHRLLEVGRQNEALMASGSKGLMLKGHALKDILADWEYYGERCGPIELEYNIRRNDIDFFGFKCSQPKGLGIRRFGLEMPQPVDFGYERWSSVFMLREKFLEPWGSVFERIEGTFILVSKITACNQVIGALCGELPEGMVFSDDILEEHNEMTIKFSAQRKFTLFSKNKTLDEICYEDEHCSEFRLEDMKIHVSSLDHYMERLGKEKERIDSEVQHKKRQFEEKERADYSKVEERRALEEELSESIKSLNLAIPRLNRIIALPNGAGGGASASRGLIDANDHLRKRIRHVGHFGFKSSQPKELRCLSFCNDHCKREYKEVAELDKIKKEVASLSDLLRREMAAHQEKIAEASLAQKKEAINEALAEFNTRKLSLETRLKACNLVDVTILLAEIVKKSNVISPVDPLALADEEQCKAYQATVNSALGQLNSIAPKVEQVEFDQGQIHKDIEAATRVAAEKAATAEAVEAAAKLAEEAAEADRLKAQEKASAEEAERTAKEASAAAEAERGRLAEEQDKQEKAVLADREQAVEPVVDQINQTLSTLTDLIGIDGESDQWVAKNILPLIAQVKQTLMCGPSPHAQRVTCQPVFFADAECVVVAKAQQEVVNRLLENVDTRSFSLKEATKYEILKFRKVERCLTDRWKSCPALEEKEEGEYKSIEKEIVKFKQKARKKNKSLKERQAEIACLQRLTGELNAVMSCSDNEIKRQKADIKKARTGVEENMKQVADALKPYTLDSDFTLYYQEADQLKVDQSSRLSLSSDQDDALSFWKRCQTESTTLLSRVSEHAKKKEAAKAAAEREEAEAGRLAAEKVRRVNQHKEHIVVLQEQCKSHYKKINEGDPQGSSRYQATHDAYCIVFSSSDAHDLKALQTMEGDLRDFKVRLVAAERQVKKELGDKKKAVSGVMTRIEKTIKELEEEPENDSEYMSLHDQDENETIGWWTERLAAMQGHLETVQAKLIDKTSQDAAAKERAVHDLNEKIGELNTAVTKINDRLMKSTTGAQLDIDMVSGYTALRKSLDPEKRGFFGSLFSAAPPEDTRSTLLVIPREKASAAMDQMQPGLLHEVSGTVSAFIDTLVVKQRRWRQINMLVIYRQCRKRSALCVMSLRRNIVQ